jgi:hypothetical protein
MKFLSSSLIVFLLSNQIMYQASHLLFASASILLFASASTQLFVFASILSFASASTLLFASASILLFASASILFFASTSTLLFASTSILFFAQISHLLVSWRMIELDERRQIEFVNCRLMIRRFKMMFWKHKMHCRKKSFDVKRIYANWEWRVKNVCVNRANFSSNSSNHLQLISLCSQRMRNRLSIFSRNLECLMSWYVRQETLSLVNLHLFKMLMSIHS